MGLGKKDKDGKELPPPPRPTSATDAAGYRNAFTTSARRITIATSTSSFHGSTSGPSDAGCAGPVTPAPEQQSPVAKPAIEALPPSPAPEPVVEEEEKESYSGLYAKKSGKPLQQVYGHIDRISQGEIGSLLERYSDRFGHELDRDIIVMRKEERDDRIAEVRDSPTVQLLNQGKRRGKPPRR